MQEAEPPGAPFDHERDRLLGLAYRLTGSRHDAEDIVQETWIRWATTAPDDVDNLAGWLTTVTTRIALDRLRSAQHRRERYVGPWLPEIVASVDEPAEHAEMAESLTVGFLAVLEQLTPVERAVFILADVFAVPFDEIGTAVGKRPEACRQIAHRARRRVADDRPRFRATDEDARAVAAALVAALRSGDVRRVVDILAPDVRLLGDGGADHRAARRPVRGAARVARFLCNLAGRATTATMEERLVNAQPAYVVRVADQVVTTLVMSVVDGLVTEVYSVVNPDKLDALDAPPLR